MRPSVEFACFKLEQFDWTKGYVRLYASKTENERDIPLSDGVRDVIQGRIRDGLTGANRSNCDKYVFPRARIATFDIAIARACRKAAEIANLNYGASGFTCHSLRHTFITDLMDKTGNDAGTVMRYSGHKTLESFSSYLHPRGQGRILAIQALNNVALFLRGFEGQEGQQGQQGLKEAAANPLQTQEVAV